ncbi:MAG TPA: type II toxin-antitoxin system VapC family toxin [Polyangiaceae bacterium]|nr:type II toxin-antitoxin system VapC family toxin [Polyangiaceae bacterium]
MADVVIDANVLVALLYQADVHHDRARQLVDRLERDGNTLVMLDFLVYEAVSVLCRRARERKTSPPDLATVLTAVRAWFRDGQVQTAAQEATRFVDNVLDVVDQTGGVLNFNDALVAVLEREGLIEQFASFDPGFDALPDFRRIS